MAVSRPPRELFSWSFVYGFRDWKYRLLVLFWFHAFMPSSLGRGFYIQCVTGVLGLRGTMIQFSMHLSCFLFHREVCSFGSQ